MTQESEPGIFKSWNWDIGKCIWVIKFCVNMHIYIYFFIGKIYRYHQILRGCLII